MKLKTILLPIDVEACPLEVFSFVNRLAPEQAARVVLLHVSKLNIAGPNGLYAEVAQEMERLLRGVQAKFISPRVASEVCVRSGEPAGEIVAAAKDVNADLILLTSHAQRRWWHRFFKNGTLEKVAAMAPCPVKILRVTSRIDCTRNLRRIAAVVAEAEWRNQWKPAMANA